MLKLKLDAEEQNYFLFVTGEAVGPPSGLDAYSSV